jgi:hypothetical protein
LLGDKSAEAGRRARKCHATEFGKACAHLREGELANIIALNTLKLAHAKKVQPPAKRAQL